MTRYVIAGKIIFTPHLYTLGNADGHDLRLSSKESEVLELLCQHQATTVTRQFLLDNAWPNGSGTGGHLNHIILSLRRKLDDLGEKDVIKTVPKVGYVLADAAGCSESFEEIDHVDNIISEIYPTFNSGDEVGYHVEYHLDDKFISDGNLLLYKDNGSQSGIEITNTSNSSSWYSFFTKKRFFVFFIILILSSTSVYFIFKSSSEHETKDHYVGINQELIKNFLVLTPLELDSKTVNDVKKIINDFDKVVDGKVYISVSPNVISIMHVNDVDETKIKKLFVSDEVEPVDILKCALSEEFDTDFVNVPPPKGYVHINKNSTVKMFNSDVISDCSKTSVKKTKNEMLFTLSLTLNTDKSLYLTDGRYRFFYADFNFSYKGREVLNTTASGNMRKEMIGSDSWDVWMIKSKNVVSFDTSTVTENVSSLKILSDFSNKDTAVYALKLDEGVYYIDFLGGIVVSTR
ncbi:winged helix-turn-helix domain-containing protein [Aeromonas dhakensis]|uniref:winged helix-turn-helix domain-containing protein n=1 Tax=Aeromonas dhakensis TaxID=196024 RepID=UPI001CF0269C|nr:helix-turn-helix domain-containing protein [Aeromonas dhakensis]UCM53432.1 helix-turn-helix domain-containing protein [Aeromonas dhakensis]